MGFSIFTCACIQEKGNFLQNLFMTGNTGENQWWYGSGYTAWMLVKIPILAYVVMRLPLTLLRTTIKKGSYR